MTEKTPSRAGSPSSRGAKRRGDPEREIDCYGTKVPRNDEENEDMKKQQGFIYILFSKRNGTLYTGVTSDLIKRVYEHKKKIVEGFTKKYNVDKLGYYEVFEDITSAIEREKQIKAGSRKNKVKLIESMNPDWKDLYETLTE